MYVRIRTCEIFCSGTVCGAWRLTGILHAKNASMRPAKQDWDGAKPLAKCYDLVRTATAAQMSADSSAIPERPYNSGCGGYHRGCRAYLCASNIGWKTKPQMYGQNDGEHACILWLLIGTTAATGAEQNWRRDRCPRRERRQGRKEGSRGGTKKDRTAGALLCSCCSRVIVSYERWRLCRCTNADNGASSPQDVRSANRRRQRGVARDSVDRLPRRRRPIRLSDSFTSLNCDLHRQTGNEQTDGRILPRWAACTHIAVTQHWIHRQSPQHPTPECPIGYIVIKLIFEQLWITLFTIHLVGTVSSKENSK